MKRTVLALYLVILASAAKASPQEEAAVRALAEVNRTSALAFDETTVTATKNGFTFQYHRQQGDATENCTAKYSSNRNLNTLDCRYESVTQALGANNSRLLISAVRTYAGRKKMVKVKGKMNRSLLIRGKRLEDRDITSPADPLIMKLSRPLLTLPPESAL